MILKHRFNSFRDRRWALGRRPPPFRVLKSRRELLCRAVRPCITNMLGPQALTKRATDDL